MGMKKHQKGNGERGKEMKDGREMNANGRGFAQADQKLRAVVKEETKRTTYVWDVCILNSTYYTTSTTETISGFWHLTREACRLLELQLQHQYDSCCWLQQMQYE